MNNSQFKYVFFYYISIFFVFSGSGKTSMANILATEIIEEMDFSEAQSSKWILMLDCKLYQKDVLGLLNVVTKFADRNLERVICTIPFRVVIIDNIDMISPTNQQGEGNK
jgi:DNA polymerase III delta prime subunit